MPDLHLDLHGFTVRVHGADAAALANVRRDFAFFERRGAPAGRAGLVLELRREPPPALPSHARPHLRTAECVGYDAGGLRYADYAGRGLAIVDFAAERAAVVSRDPHLLHEVAYMIILSRAGEALDRRGIHRVHSLAVARAGIATLCLLPSGGGKTTLALELLAAHAALLLSDEQAAIDATLEVLPVPLRLGLDPAELAARAIPASHVRTLERVARPPKALVDLAYFADHVATGPARLGTVLFGRRSARRATALVRLSAPAAARLLLPELVRGRELPQTKVYFFRRDPRYLARLTRMLGARARRALRIARTVACYRFELTNDPAENAAVLRDLGG